MASITQNLPPLDPEPGPRLVEPLPADRPVRWGILATGGIARSFAADLALLPEASLAAVASRRMESAREFASMYDARPHGSYEALVEDPEVDVVYVATPHSLHKENTLMAFEAGKPVLCEKSLTLNARDAEELVATARERGLFFMEAMWMRCNPVIRRLTQLARSGRLGTVLQVRADLGFVVDRPSTDRTLAPELGGGALLDMGVYPITFAHLFLGEPTRVEAVATMSDLGVDVNLAISLGWTAGDRTEVVAEDVVGTGLAHEAREVVRCLRNGETESPLVPLEETVALMRLMDLIRSRIGLSYAAD